MSAPARTPIHRFAPTPNGRLHLGHAYSALCNAAFARRAGGKLLLRIEDIDPVRCKREYEDAILEDMAWLGIEFDGAVRRQSEHFEDYYKALASLQARDLLYPCFCTRGEIALANPGARDPDGAPLHAGACVAVGARERQARLAAGEPAALRLDMARALRSVPVKLDWREFGEGFDERRVEATPESWGDVVLRGKGRPAAYHLAVVVDDALQSVSEIVRGRDLFASTSVHRLLQALLGLEAPVYRHHRLVLDAAGKKMSKSASSPPLAVLRAAGVSAGEVRAALGFECGALGRLRVVLS
jgi:glutamyl-Q tRNA(Asp) synthetase